MARSSAAHVRRHGPADSRRVAAPRPVRSSARHPYLELQRSVGNRAVASLANGRPTGPVPLRSPLFASDPTLVSVANGKSTLRRRSKGPAVALVQEALEQFTYFKRDKAKTFSSGKADGIFGSETVLAVRTFRHFYGLPDQRDIDSAMLQRMDALRLPAVATRSAARSVDPDEEKTGEEVAKRMTEVNTRFGPQSGVHYPFNYRKLRERYLAREKDYGPYYTGDVDRGYADPALWERSRTQSHYFRLVPGKSASEAIQAWLRGLTVADCFAALIAIELDTARRAMGDDRFDARFGKAGDTSNSGDDPATRLTIGRSFADSSFKSLSKKTQGATAGRSMARGEWYYVSNHPKFLLKHPASYWQGENALYMGKDPNSGERLWSGMGVNSTPEKKLFEHFVAKYNRKRSERDYRKLLKWYQKPGNGPDWDPALRKRFRSAGPADLERLFDDAAEAGLIDPEHFELIGFPAKITVPDLTNAAAYAISSGPLKNARARTGGVRRAAGRELDPNSL